MFKNLHELISTMPTDKICREYLAKERWNGVIVCPYCSCEGAYVIEDGKRFKCKSKACYKKFSVTVGTIFEASNIPLNKWFMAIYICTAHKKGISSYQLGKDIGIAQKSGWFMLHRIREMIKQLHIVQLKGAIEIDETYMARKFGSDYKAVPPEKVKYLKKYASKGAVVGMAERGANIKVLSFDDRKGEPIKEAIHKHVEYGSRLLTDEAFMYRSGLDQYQHAAVYHSKMEWVRNDVHTNTVENFWSVIKRGVYGIYHQISYKHLQRYCDEFAYRYNNRKMKDADRFNQSFSGIIGRLDYKTLIGKK